MEPLVVSAPGKVILHGEHAVVFGKTALAAAVDLRTYLIVRPREDQRVVVNMSTVDMSYEWTREDMMEMVTLNKSSDGNNPRSPTEAFLQLLKTRHGLDVSLTTPKILAATGFLHLLTCIVGEDISKMSGLEFCAVSNLPVSAGLGSSATFAVCMAAAMLLLSDRIYKEASTKQFCKSEYDTYLEDIIPEEMKHKLKECLGQFSKHGNIQSFQTVALPEEMKCLVCDWSFQCERLIHGTPSGIDNSVSCFGGMIKYTSGKMTALKDYPVLNVLLANTCVPRSTKAMVAGVKERYDQFPQVIKPVLDSIQAISEHCEAELTKLHHLQSSTTTSDNLSEADIYKRLNILIDMNQHSLNLLGVGHPQIDVVCKVTKEYGLSSKLTGAGGGGCVLTLLPQDLGNSEESVRAIKEKLSGFELWKTKLACLGVCIHVITN